VTAPPRRRSLGVFLGTSVSAPHSVGMMRLYFRPRRSRRDVVSLRDMAGTARAASSHRPTRAVRDPAHPTLAPPRASHAPSHVPRRESLQTFRPGRQRLVHRPSLRHDCQHLGAGLRRRHRGPTGPLKNQQARGSGAPNARAEGRYLRASYEYNQPLGTSGKFPDLSAPRSNGGPSRSKGPCNG
jgi:hypothetical protein